MRWRRPYGRGWFQVFIGVLLLCGIGVTIGLIAVGASKVSTHPGSSVVELLIAAVFGTVWIGFLGRVALMGIYTNDTALRYRGFVRTVTIPWTSVKRVRLAPLTTGWVTDAAGAKTIWIDRAGEPSIQTWVNNKGADFLGRQKAFDRAFLAIQAEVEAHPHGVGSH